MDGEPARPSHTAPRKALRVGPLALVVAALLASGLPLPAQALGSALSNVNLHAPTQKAGEVETWTIGFDLPETGNLANYKVITYFPDGYAVQAGSACDVEGASESISVNGLDVTCTIVSGTFAPNSRLTTHITQVRNPTFAQTTPAFSVKFENPLGVTVGTANSLTERIYNNQFTSLAAAAWDDRAGETTDWTLRLGTKNAVGANGDVRLLFPLGFIVQSDAACDITGLSGPTLTWISATEAVCQLNAASLNAGQTYDLTLTRVQNPGWSQSPLLRVQSRNADNKVHDELNATLTVQPHPFAAASATADDSNPGAKTTWKFSFTTFNPWPSDGCLRVTFPAGFSFDPSSSMTLSQGADGSMASINIQGNAVTACRQGGSPVAAGSQVVASVTNVTNPNTVDPFDALNATLNTLLSDPTAFIDQTGDIVLGLLPSECTGDCGDGGGIGTPSPPRNLTVARQSGQARLSWTPPNDPGQTPVGSYRIYRSTASGGDFALAAQVENVTAYSEPEPSSGSVRLYFARAVNTVGASNASNLVSITIPAGQKPAGPPRVIFPGPTSSVPRVDPLAGDESSGSSGFPPAAVQDLIEAPATRAVAAGLLVLGLGAGGTWAAWRRMKRLRPRA